jgi:hypothetical protein
LVFWWLFRCHLCRRTHQAVGPVSGLSVNLFQAALLHLASSPLKSIRHRLGSEPPTGYEDDDPLLADDGYNHIHESSAIHSLLTASSAFTSLRFARLFRITATSCNSPASCPSAVAMDFILGNLLYLPPF